MLQIEELHNMQQEHYEEVAASFLDFVRGNQSSPTLFEAATGSHNGEAIVKALNGSQMGFLRALRFTLQREGLGELQSELYSKQYDSSLEPAFYVALQWKDESVTILLGEHFFRPLEDVTEAVSTEHAQIMDYILEVMARFKTAAAYDMTLEMLEQLRHHTEQTEAITPKSLEEEDEMNEEKKDLLEQLLWETSERELEAPTYEDEPATYEDELDETEEEQVNSLAQLGSLVLELYKQASSESRSVIKQLRADLFEMEAAVELEENAAQKTLQFHQQVLALQLETVEELKLQVELARQSLALLTSENM